jgi:hypothetical protein
MEKGQSIEESIQLVQIEPEEILFLITEMAKSHDEGQGTNWYTQVGILANRYPNQPERVVAIVERMKCLIDLFDDQRMRGWTLASRDPSCIITNEAVFRAAALAPIHLLGEKFKFDADEFFSIALSETDAEGNA